MNPATTKNLDTTRYLLLAAALSSFSFNNIFLNKYSYILGSLSFYFLFFSLLTLNFQVDRRQAKYLLVFLIYIIISAFASSLFNGIALSNKPFKSIFYIGFIFLVVQQVSYQVFVNRKFRKNIKSIFLFSGYVIIITSIIDILAITHGGAQTSIFENSYLRAWQPYTVSRLRGFTQEPSYFGMVLSVVFPFVICKFITQKKLVDFVALILIYVCILFTLSKVAIITCSILTFFILLNNYRSFLSIVIALILAFLLAQSFGLNKVVADNYWYLSQWGSHAAGGAAAGGAAAGGAAAGGAAAGGAAAGGAAAGGAAAGGVAAGGVAAGGVAAGGAAAGASLSLGVKVDTSTSIRLASILACFRLWHENFLLGVGAGQSGFYLNKFYPDYALSFPEILAWSKLSEVGGVPSFSFIPKLLCEIGLFGLLILINSLIHNLKKIEKFWKGDAELRTFCYAFLGFLISSFAVEGYLYMPAWMILGCIFGRIRINIHS